MIDLVRIKIDGSMNWNNPLLEYVTHTDQHTYCGQVRNVYIKQNLDGVVINGSLSKYLNGQNVQPFNRHEVKQALELLGSELGLDLDNGIVTTIELGTCLCMKNPVSEYIKCFGHLGRYKRNVWLGVVEESLCYKNKSGREEFHIYDKNEELKSWYPPAKLSEVYKGTNLLRIEIRVRNRTGVKSLLGRDIKPMELAETEVYGKLIDRFKRFYKSIPKNGQSVLVSLDQPITPSKYESIQAECFRQLHPDLCLDMLNTGRELGLITDKNMERIKAQERRKNTPRIDYLEKNELIYELDEKLRLTGLY